MGDVGMKPRRASVGVRPRPWGRAMRDGLLIGVPIAGTLWLATTYQRLGTDYLVNAWTAGRNFLHGVNVYVSPASLAAKHFAFFDWGALSAVLLAPLSLLPSQVASAIFVAVCIVSLFGTLRVLGVRDWRVYAVVMTWPFVVLGWLYGNIELPMALGLALAWRYRDRPQVSGPLVAVLISVKILLWPIALWLLATRRYRTLKHAAIWGLIINLGAWALVGFGQIGRYVALLPVVARLAQPQGSGVISLAVHLGLTTAVSYAIALGIAAALAAACLPLDRRTDDQLTFTLAIVISLVATPIVNPYYYTLLLIPLAIARPRFRPVWALPVVIWLAVIAFGGWGAVGTSITFLCMMACFVAASVPRGRYRPVHVGEWFGHDGIAAWAGPAVTSRRRRSS
jgi:Glycosyltransferase family 87